MTVRTALYRHYDAAGALLYVGISNSPLHRLGQHGKTAAWHDHLASSTTEWFDTREAAAAAEVEAIRSEKPRHNIAHAIATDPIRRFVSEVGVSELSVRLGVGNTAISNAVVRGKFPCSWAFVTATICAERGLFFPANGFPWSGEAPADDVSVAVLFRMESAQ